MDKYKYPIYGIGKSCVIAGLAMCLLICPDRARASEHSDCKFPSRIVLGTSGNVLLFKRNEKVEPILLDELNIWTKGKWVLGFWTPKWWAGEVGIHLYPWRQSNFLTKYEDIDTTDTVQFFAACKAGKQYSTIPGTFAKAGDLDVKKSNAIKDWNGYLGMTIAPEGTKPALTLKGDLFEFGSAKELWNSVGSTP